MLSGIRDLTQGKFYYIENSDMVDECFIDCIGALLSNIGGKA